MKLNENLLQKYLDLYIKHFYFIHHQEEYKWRAVKTFQENWDIDALNPSMMLSESVKGAKNLLTSSNFFPLNNLHEFANGNPDRFRFAFKNLLDDTNETADRIVSFKNECTLFLQTLDDPKKKFNYNGFRSSMVFLTLKKPEKHFLYKFEMYKLFCNFFGLPQPKKGRLENIINYEIICNQIRDFLKQNNHLLHLHNSVLGQEHYSDSNLHIRTQDFVYACTTHLHRINDNSSSISKYGLTDKDIAIGHFSAKKKTYNLKPGLAKKDIEREKQDKIIGTYGENLVYYYLKNKYDGEATVLPHFDIDDSKGYDIGVVMNGAEIKRIEVKTTKGKLTTPFYISNFQLLESQEKPGIYELWRVYNFDPKKGKAKCQIFRGSLESLCTNPIKFEVLLSLDKS